MSKKLLTEEEELKRKQEELRAKEVLEIIKDIDNLEKSLKSMLTLEDLKITKKYISKKIQVYNSLKRAYFKDDDFTNYEKCRREIISYKKLNQLLNRLRKEFTVSTSSIKKETIDKKEHIISNIKMLDFYFSDKDKEIFNKYLESNSYEEKLDLLFKLREIYIKATYYLYRHKKHVFEEIYKKVAKENGLEGNLKKNKKEFYYILNKENYSDFKLKLGKAKEQYNKSKIFLEGLEKLIKYENSAYKNSLPKKYVDIDDTDYNEIIGDNVHYSKEFIKKLENIRDGKYIRKYGLALEKFVPQEITKLFADLENLDKETLEKFSLLGIDVSKNKLRSLRHGQNCYDDVEREFLKYIIKSFEKIKPNDITFEEPDTSIYYDILNALVDNDNNFSYIEKLIEEIPLMKSARKDNKHLIISLIDKFILNYKLKLANQGFNYIEPAFYKEIIKDFYKKDVDLTAEEKDIIENRLNEFLNYVNDRKYVSSKTVADDVDELKNKTVFSKSSIDKDKVAQELKFLDISKDSIVNQYRRKYPIYVNNNTTSVFMIAGIDNCCFSIDYSNYENITFGIHFLDTSKLVDEDSEIVKGALEEKPYLPKLQMNEYEPVMSFTYHFVDFKHLTDVRFSNGLVYVNKLYKDKDLENYRNKEDLKNMYIFLNNFKSPENINSIYTTAGLKETIFKTLSNDLKRKFYNYKIPFIYERKQEESEDLIRLNHNTTCDKLYKIPKDEAHRIFKILDETLDKYYVPNQAEDVDIVFDTSSFLGYYLMHILGKIQTGKYDIDKESENLKNYLEKLNSQRAYLPANIIKSNEAKLKRIVRRYKKK